MRSEPFKDVSSVGDRPFARIWRLAVLGACAGLVIASGVIGFIHWGAGAPRTAAPRVLASVAPEHMVLQSDWNEQITRDTYWRAGRNPAPSTPSQRGRSHLQGPPPPPSWYMPGPSSNSWFSQPQQPFWSVPADQQSMPSRPRSAGYRTVCVRLCDGFFFPVGFGASEESFSRGQAACDSVCPGSRLYYNRTSSDDSDDMVDVTGQSYTKLKNANLFRTQYVESCKCKPHPWEQEAADRHRIYALEDQQRRGNRAVAAELDVLKTKVRVERTSSRRQQQEKRKRKVADEEARLDLPGQPQLVKPALPAPRSDASRGQGGDRHAALAQPAAQTARTEPPPSPVRKTAASTQAGGAEKATAPAEMPARTVPPEQRAIAGAGAGAGAGDAALLAPLPASIRPGSTAAAAPTVSMPASPADTNGMPTLQPVPEKRRKSRDARAPRPAAQPAQPGRARTADWVARAFNP